MTLHSPTLTRLHARLANYLFGLDADVPVLIVALVLWIALSAAEWI